MRGGRGVNEMVWPADLADRVVAGELVSNSCGRIRVHSLVSSRVHWLQVAVLILWRIKSSPDFYFRFNRLACHWLLKLRLHVESASGPRSDCAKTVCKKIERTVYIELTFV
jgi:hypothetical protein